MQYSISKTARVLVTACGLAAFAGGCGRTERTDDAFYGYKPEHVAAVSTLAAHLSAGEPITDLLDHSFNGHIGPFVDALPESNRNAIAAGLHKGTYVGEFHGGDMYSFIEELQEPVPLCIVVLPTDLIWLLDCSTTP